MLAIPDLHHPWEHPRALEFVLQVRDKWKPDRIISLGDFYDMASFSRYPMNPDMPSPHDELELAIESAQDWYDRFEKIEVVNSNHDARPLRKLIGAGLPSRIMKEFRDIIQSPNEWDWGTHEIEIDGVIYFHGEGLNASSSKTAYNKLRGSVVHGHLHSSAHVSYSQSRKNRLFSMNAGALIDSRQKAFDYARTSHERTCLGVGVIVDGEQAFFIPMPEKMQKNFK